MVARLGHNLGGSAQSSRKGVGGAAGTGHRLSTELISPQSETWLGIPGRPPSPPPSSLRSPPAPPPSCSLWIWFPVRRFDFWSSRRARFFSSAAWPWPRRPALLLSERREATPRKSGLSADRSKALPELTFHPGLGAGVVLFCFLFREFVFFLFSVSFIFIIYKRVLFQVFCVFFFRGFHFSGCCFVSLVVLWGGFCFLSCVF